MRCLVDLRKLSRVRFCPEESARRQGEGVPELPDLDALLTTTEAARYAGVTPAAIVNWRRRGHLTPAGTRHGSPLYRLLDVAKAEAATRRKARRT